jgi:dipeptidyl aminopeptidase/acylaminoacyl peptidase
VTTSVPEQHTEQGVDTPETFEGRVSLSLAPLDSEGTPARVGIYDFDVAQGTLVPLAADTTADYLTSQYSPDGTMIAFARVDDEGMTIMYGASDLSSVDAITMPEEVFIARNPVWSPDGSRIAFTTRSDGTGSEMGLDEWSVHVYDLASRAVSRVATGTNPLYLPDGSLLVLREDGLHRLDEVTGTDTRIIPMAMGEAAANMKLDVSNDGKRLVWAVPDRGTVAIYDVQAWEPLEASVTEIRTSAFWPTLSPGGEYLALQAFDWGSDGTTVTNYRLVFYSFRDGAWKEIALDLSPFYQEALFITDWRY